MLLRELVQVIDCGPIQLVEPHQLGCDAAPKGYYETVEELKDDDDVLDLVVSGVCSAFNTDYDTDVLEVGVKDVHELVEEERPYMLFELAESRN